MGNCCSDETGGRSAFGGTGASATGGGANDAVDEFLRYRGFQGLFSQIELSFSATNLRDRDMISKSDPMMVVYTKGRDGALTEAFRTEVVLNSLNPSWIAKYTVTFQFEVVQTLLFRVYDIDTQFHNVDVKIVAKPDRTLTLNLVQIEDPGHPRSSGQLIVHAEECISSKTTTEMTLRCSDLESKDLFSKSDPFLSISRVTEGGMPVVVCKAEVIKNDHNPTWKPISLNIQQVGSKDSPLLIQCFDFNSSGKHDLIGQVQISLAGLEKLCSSQEGVYLSLLEVGHNRSTKVLKSQLCVDKFSESIQHTFLDYLRGGYELNFMVAVDFTVFVFALIRMAILEVGEVLQFYDSDKRFPAWGFGARPIDGPVSHCFNLNGSNYNHEVEGLHGILMAYSSALYNVSFAGPTLFGPVITKAATIASKSLENGGRKYYVLLIITDGVITDLQETKDAIVQASDLPLSILIVGVGGADFKEMEILDGDKGERLESTTGRVATRDIVQFVPLRDVQNGGGISVVQELLAELPSQFLTYVRARKLQPHS
ncbi:unnamed protein product [Linum tenue]|uniref:C2 domain-containing protein n=1 Tax=Linum tenue TaxID=586396 RepID=A0AAV0QRC1_9ROSI|nr:unnamed protein product [Linum tenue]